MLPVVYITWRRARSSRNEIKIKLTADGNSIRAGGKGSVSHLSTGNGTHSLSVIYDAHHLPFKRHRLVPIYFINMHDNEYRTTIAVVKLIVSNKSAFYIYHIRDSKYKFGFMGCMGLVSFVA